MRWLLLALLLLPATARADADVLWRIVHDRCVPNMIAHQNPAPCTEVDLAGGTALLKDLVGPAQFLLIPTAKVTGIEDPVILAADAPNYFAAAWAARGRVAERLGRPLQRQAISLAINSPAGRSQNQLHIHIDCLRPDIAARLADTAIGPDWAPLPGGLAGHPYLARRLAGPDLTENPFRLLPGAPGQFTLAVAASADGFILLADRINLLAGDSAHGEELQDHTCQGY